MKRSHKLCFGLSLVFSIMLGSFLNVSSDVSATDYSYNIVNGTSTLLCKSTTSDPSPVPLCDDIKTLTFSTDSSFSGSIRPSFVFDRSSSLDCSSTGSSAVYIPFTVSSSVSFYPLSHLCGIRFGDSYSLSGSTQSWVVTLSTQLPGSSPSGSLSITENGTYDVSSYSVAVVNVENEVIYGDYHDDLVSINNSILICAAVCLVIYFFYAIYKMLLGGRR